MFSFDIYVIKKLGRHAILIIIDYKHSLNWRRSSVFNVNFEYIRHS